MSSRYSITDSSALNNLVFELIERLSRFSLHLQNTKEINEDNNGYTKDSSLDIILSGYNECLSSIFFGLVTIQKAIIRGSCANEKAIDLIKKLFEAIRELHKTLVHLPKPSAPRELHRFNRILDKHIMILTTEISETTTIKSGKTNAEAARISIYLSDDTAAEAFVKSPLLGYKDNDLKPILDNIAKEFGGVVDNSEEKFGHHIAIPRIECKNPCCWPSFVHEVAHKIFNSNFFESGDILIDFRNFFNNQYNPTLPGIDIKSWLVECWCDLLAAVVMGPSFWFAQSSAFLFGGNLSKSKSHPPADFRLFLIEKILDVRFPQACYSHVQNAFCEAEKMLVELQNNCFPEDDNLRELARHFRYYFNKKFFREDESGRVSPAQSLQKHLNKFVKYNKGIDENVIRRLCEKLECGFPIPSIRDGGHPLQERFTSVQEILLTAWLIRNSKIKECVLVAFAELVRNNDQNIKCLWLHFNEDISTRFEVFDNAVLRSIQVGEWIDLFSEKEQKGSPINDNSEYEKNKSVNATDGGILADFQISQRLIEKDTKKAICVIPLISHKAQLGSTSLDIRLGTSFQVYYPNRSGILDFTDTNSVKSAGGNSVLVDLDYMESITIAPGQFVLGHSMEYISLPDDLAAEIEGRSSFARLGVEVHMTAGFVDPGFQGVLTYEIFNGGPNPIKLFPGLRIAQLRFFLCAPSVKPYNRNPSAKYKGLLAHRDSLHSKDYEIMLLKNEIEKRYNSGLE